MRANILTRKGRAAAERLMTDTLTITRQSGRPVTDPITGKVTYPTMQVYSGKGRVQSRDVDAEDIIAAGTRTTLAEATVQVPVGVALAVDDEVTVDASLTDPLMVGRVFRVVIIPRKTHATMVRAGVEEVTS